MLFRLLSAIGAIAHVGDAIVAPFLKFKNAPTRLRAGGARIAGALALGAILAIVSIYAFSLAAEGSANQAPTVYSVDQLSGLTDLGGKTYATIRGVEWDWHAVHETDNKYDYTAYLFGNPNSGNLIVVVSKTKAADMADRADSSDVVTLTGMLRNDTNEIQKTIDTVGDKLTPGLEVNKTYILRDGETPADPGIMLPVAVVTAVLTALFVAGWAIGYLVFRPAKAVQRLSTGGMSASVTVRVTGLIPGPVNGTRAREKLADLRLGEVDEDPAGFGGPQPVDLVWMERNKQLNGVRLAPGISKIEMGKAYPLRGARPAIRVRFGSFKLIMTFADEAARDAAFDQLRMSAGLALAPSAVSAVATA